MNYKSLFAVTLTALAFIPVACTIETKDDNDGAGGADEKGGASSSGGSTAKGGESSSGGKSSGGTTAAGGAVSNAGAAGSSAAAGGATSAAGAANVAGSTGIGGSVSNGGTSAAAGSSNQAGAAGATTVVPRTRVDVTGEVDAATTWTADHIYVIPAGSTIYVSATLTIQPGTIVKFGAGARLYIESAGQLNAIGTSAAHIVFTGIKDDVGGDTNGDGNASTPSAGDWSTIEVMANSSAFDYAEVRYSTAGVDLAGNNQSLKHSILTNNTLALDAQSVTAPATAVITDNVFYANTTPVRIKGGTAVDATNVFHNPATPTQVNTFQAIEVYGSIANSVTWNNTEVAYALPASGGSYYVQDPAALTVAAGVVVKVGNSSAIIVESGATLNQTATSIFTSYKDDSKLGDSNGDGTATTAAAGDWDGVRVITGTSDDWLTGANILYSTN